jgi:flavorubredoxin
MNAHRKKSKGSVQCHHQCPSCNKEHSHFIGWAASSLVDEYFRVCDHCVKEGKIDVVAKEISKNANRAQQLADELAEGDLLAGLSDENHNDLQEVVQDLHDFVAGRETQADDILVDSIVATAMRRVGGAEKAHGSIY